MATPTTITTAVANMQDAAATAAAVVARTVTLTQTITNAGVVTTATVTLGRGSPPNDSPPPPARGSSDSDGLGPTQIGIIVGCCLGAFLLAAIAIGFCVMRRRARARDYDYDGDGMSEWSSNADGYWPTFPQSIPPPAEPEYTATVPAQRWTAYRAGGRGRTYVRR